MNKEKQPYVPPTLGVVVVEMEQGIAAGSGHDGEMNTNKNLSESWDSQESQESSTW